MAKKQYNSHFEDFSNDLFYEIFDYLDGFEIYQSFFNLNFRFQHLLYSSNLQLKLNLIPIIDHPYENEYFNILNQQKHQIISLRFMHIDQIQRFFYPLIIDSSFIRLQSIVLINLPTENLIEYLTNLTFLPCLSSLKIFDNHHQIFLHEIYQRIFQIKTLNYFKLSSQIYRPKLFLSADFQWSSIQYLTMNHSCYLDDLYAILSHTPRVIRLICQELLQSTNKQREIIHLNCLTMISILECYVCFDKFEEFLKLTSTHLQMLRIDTYWDANYLDAYRWENLIQKNLFTLEEFSFQHHDFLDDDFQLTKYHILINQFKNVELTIEMTDQLWTEIIYSFHLSKKSSKNIRLTLIGSFSEDFFTENIFMILTRLPITRLDILHDEISIEMFRDLLDYLPNLKTIKFIH